MQNKKKQIEYLYYPETNLDVILTRVLPNWSLLFNNPFTILNKMHA